MKKNSLNYSTHEDRWGAILSQDEEKIKDAMKILNQETVEFIICHLIKMATEEGWHPAQQVSAAFALKVIKAQILD